MRRIALILALLVATAATVATVAGADEKRTYQVELDNAFGLVTGSDLKIGGVVSGSITDLDINAAKKALVTIEVTGPFSDLREDANCSSEPQSLIAEFFLDCQRGQSSEPLAEGPDGIPLVPVKQTKTTVQNDLVNNILREPFKRRFQLIINEFGTGLAGNPENLNEAIRRGAPALRNLNRVLNILAGQNRIIRDLNVNSDQVIGKLAANKANVQRFIDEANDTAAASASRRADLARDFHLLPGFLGELRPALVRLDKVLRNQTPILSDLRRSSGQLTTLSENLPEFNDATRISLQSLGDASQEGKVAFRKATDEIADLNRASKNAPGTAAPLADFLRALDDPARYVEEDTRATDDTGRPQPTGYTGLEGLLNYVYYQTASINQFDQVGHLLHVVLQLNVEGPCFAYNTGGETQDLPKRGEPAGGEKTRDPNQVHECVSILGPNQPQINQTLSAPPYAGAVCDQQPAGEAVVSAGDAFGRADPICVDPSPASAGSRSAGASGASGGGNPLQGLGLPTDLLDRILGGARRNGTQLRGTNEGATNDLLRFLFG
jgi:phospholipid/cholesterol/gamma-HCH transport system substrate-binding protein